MMLVRSRENQSEVRQASQVIVQSFQRCQKKKEQLALAQLKRSQLLKQHELGRRMAELNFEKEYMEAQMEEERAIVSLNVYKEESDNNSEHENGNKNTLSMNHQGHGL
jgi:hypothetical protein